MVTEPGCCPECQRVDPCKTVACKELVCEEHKMLIFPKGECCPKCLPTEGNYNLYKSPSLDVYTNIFLDFINFTGVFTLPFVTMFHVDNHLH